MHSIDVNINAGYLNNRQELSLCRRPKVRPHVDFVNFTLYNDT